jgi:hypothetical protein
MRLYEVAGNQFQDDLANILKVMQGRANSQHTTSVVLWQDINNRLKGMGYSSVNADMMAKIKDQVDPNGSLIQDVTDKGIILVTDVASPEQQLATNQGGSKTVDQMAHSAAQDSLK